MKRTNLTRIENQTFSAERALYHATDVLVRHCAFEGEEDGESALKESSDITVQDSVFKLRYPFWHVTKGLLERIQMTDTCRAALWYCKNLTIKNSELGGIKALRECRGVKIQNCTVESKEFGWQCRNISLRDSSLVSEYPFLHTETLKLDHFTLNGKYSFQYTKNVTITDSVLNTKDAFWHAKNVTVKDSVIRGEYLGWYSDGLTLVRCKIQGTQPLCYCKNLKLIDCEMEDADLAFEYSDVKATVLNDVVSVKNPRSGKIKAHRIGQIIRENAVYDCDCEIETEC